LWDIKINQKLEEQWSKKMLKNPTFKIPHHKYTTFAGYVYFNKMTEKQEKYYEILKASERGDNEVNEEDTPQESFYEKIISMLKENKLDEKNLLNICLFNNKKLSNVKVRVNQLLKDEGNGKTLRDFLVKTTKDKDINILHNNNNTLKEINIDL